MYAVQYKNTMHVYAYLATCSVHTKMNIPAKCIAIYRQCVHDTVIIYTYIVVYIQCISNSKFKEPCIHEPDEACMHL